MPVVMDYLLPFMAFVIDYLIPFVVVLSVLVFIHEYGHFIVARWNNVTVEVFSIGFGSELFGYTDSKGTRWRFSLIPLGGYVRMLGDANESSATADDKLLKEMTDEERAQTLHAKKPWQKIAVAAAGPAANYLFAILLLAFIYIFKGQPEVPTYVGSVKEGSLAATIGLKKGDHITKVDDHVVGDIFDFKEKLSEKKGQEVTLTIDRGGNELTIPTQLMAKDKEGKLSPTATLGFAPDTSHQTYTPVGFIDSFVRATQYCWHISAQTLKGIGQMITGTRSQSELGGILSIGEMAGQSLKAGYISMLLFIALLSINLGLLNLLPIPVLDGGQILMSMIEGVIRRPVPEKAKEYIFMAGFVLVIGLMITATWNDVVRFRIFDTLRGLIGL